MKFALLSLAGCAVAQDIFLSKTGPSHADLTRAQTRKQPGPLAGSTPQEISTKLNTHIEKMGGAKKDCDQHSLSELNDIVRNLSGRMSDELQDIYSRNGDSRAKRFGTLAEYESSWVNEEDDDETLRHSKCFEIGELWAHHLPEGAKQDLVASVPTLPVFDEKKANNELYKKATSCQTGHAMVAGGDGTSTHKWPDWPEELHYKAKGHGAYPFWWGGGSDSGTADLEVWWSEKQGAEKFYHSSCKGQSSWLRGACVHLMLAPGASMGDKASPQAYLYLADESKCCLAEPTGSGRGPSETLAPSQGNFWNTFKYKGEVDFKGVYYQGKAKYYVLTGVNEPVRSFWYFTDLNDMPVQQGEAGTGPTDQGYPSGIGHTIWHDYNQSSFDTSGIDSSVFAIPEVCKTTKLKCAFP